MVQHEMGKETPDQAEDDEALENIRQNMDRCHVDDALSLTLIRRKDKYEPQERIRLRNDLLLIVGYLEFFNALDFPANIWNSIPVPTFAVGLMATGGSIALLASSFAFFDFRRSWRNIKLLRKERTYLQE